MSVLKKIHHNHERGRSRRVTSNQFGMHPDLEDVVLKHMEVGWKQPLHKPTVSAFEGVEALLAPGEAGNLVLDSGCGTGESSRCLSAAHPDCVVIGIDRSLARLEKGGDTHFPYRRGNVIMVRAELSSFWRLALAAGWRLHIHYLLYPNPWPKAGHLMRRWHGHPVFPALLALGGRLVLRTNWEIYAREFALALQLAGQAGVALRQPVVEVPLSPFERKYARSGHVLHEVICPGSGKRTSRSRAA